MYKKHRIYICKQCILFVGHSFKVLCQGQTDVRTLRTYPPKQRYQDTSKKRQRESLRKYFSKTQTRGGKGGNVVTKSLKKNLAFGRKICTRNKGKLQRAAEMGWERKGAYKSVCVRTCVRVRGRGRERGRERERERERGRGTDRETD